MLVTTALALCVPCAVATLFVAARSAWSRPAADARGIALQTVIVMVVLLAVAGGVATVLLTRGGEAITDIENQEIARKASNYSNDRLCDAAGFVWSSIGANSGCNPDASGLTIQQQRLNATTQAACTALGGTWADHDSDPNTTNTCA